MSKTMDKNTFFERNIRALSEKNAELCALLSRINKIDPGTAHYSAQKSRSGESIPVWVSSSDSALPLHSTMDPRKEAKRLINTVENAGFLIFLGLGGGFYAEAALERDDVGLVLVIEYDLLGLWQLLKLFDYSALFSDPRFRILLDVREQELIQAVLNLYQPALFGGVRMIPLRSRTGIEPKPFARAASAIDAAIKNISTDYSVQAHFGKRWFSNVIRNLCLAENTNESLPRIKRAAVCAAGPSLSQQMKQLEEKRKGLYLIATDTSLPCLLHAGLKPDAVISIDCQHISYLHFMDGFPEGVLLFLDLSSPRLITGPKLNYHFFTGGHPFTRYISEKWKAFLTLDTSGGNVTHAAVSLAEALGAEEIELYGADFSYPVGFSYARGAYVYPFFESRQNRFSPLEAQHSIFLFRTPLEKKYHTVLHSGASWYYETETLKLYRERLEEKNKTSKATLIPIEGMGAPLQIVQKEKPIFIQNQMDQQKPTKSAADFLCHYCETLRLLPEAEKNAAEYLGALDEEGRAVFATITPTLAALKKRLPELNFKELFETARTQCIKKIDAVLSQ